MPPRSISSDIAPASSEAVEVIGTPGQGPFVLTAEHASAAVPPPWTPTPDDHAVLSTHWGWDRENSSRSKPSRGSLSMRSLVSVISHLPLDLGAGG